MQDDEHHGEEQHEHRGKFTEGKLDDALILATLHPKPGQRVLDAGCGNGYMARRFAEAVGASGTVYALDSDPQAVRHLEAELESPNLRAVLGDLGKPIPLGDGSLDLVYISAVMHGFTREERQSFVAEVGRLLVPGGLLGIVEIAKHETDFGPPLHIRLSPEDLEAMIPMDLVETVDVAEHFYLQVFSNGPAWR